MTWHDIDGHDRVVDQFRRALERRRLASSFLFVGPAGVGKKTFALKLAQALLCETREEAELDPCGTCGGCQQVAAGSHPDLLQIAKPADKNFIPVELFIGDREHRMREGLCRDIALKPFRGGRRIAIIDDADHLNQEGANCLLKTLEEPPPRSLIFLLSTSEQKQLPTIRSRCQVVRFDPLPENVVAELLVSRGLVEDAHEARRLAALGGGSLTQAMALADEDLGEFRAALLDCLSQSNHLENDFVKTLGSFIDAAGKEAPRRRARMRQVFNFAAEFYRQLMRTLGGAMVEGDEMLKQAVTRAAATWSCDEQAAAECLSRCLEAHLQIDANANQATLLECWLDDLAEISRLGRLSVA